MAFNTTRMAAGMDAAAATITHVAWSENGSSESSNVARTAVSVTSATTANPSVIANDDDIESAEASGACTITHFAFHDGTGPVTTWNELDDPVVLLEGGKITAAAGELTENWHQTTSAPS